MIASDGRRFDNLSFNEFQSGVMGKHSQFTHALVLTYREAMFGEIDWHRRLLVLSRSVPRGSTAYWKLAVTCYRLVLIILCTVRYILPDFTFDPFGLDFQPQAIVDAHILICYPDQREQRDQISAPISEQQFESSEDQ